MVDFLESLDAKHIHRAAEDRLARAGTDAAISLIAVQGREGVARRCLGPATNIPQRRAPACPHAASGRREKKPCPCKREK
jgi:hypothetical protein